jgi:NAD(P)-dependent dehydrogenase (short-subunit alcohol dehydrogenase family)
MNEWHDQVVLVTGAAGNLGRAVAAVIKKAGAARLLLDHDAATLEAEFQAEGDRRTLLAGGVDLLDPVALGKAIVEAERFLGPVTALVHTVGAFRSAPFHETPGEWWTMLIDANLGTAVAACRAVLPGMVARRRGRIVTVGARVSLAGRGRMAAYAATKAALLRLSESLADEVRDLGITVNCVLPGTLDTPTNRADQPGADWRRWVAPEAVADVIVFLLSDAARAVSGAAIPVLGRS